MLDLTKYCAPERAELAEPWSDREYTYASNGLLAIRMPRIATVPLVTPMPGYAPLSDAIDKMLPLRQLPDVIVADDVIVPPAVVLPFEACKQCAGSGVTAEIKCRDCNGNGYVSCEHCKHSHDCDSCNGYGSAIRAATKDEDSKDVCTVCDGVGDYNVVRLRLNPQPMKVGKYMFSRNLFVLLATLPDVRIDATRVDWFMDEKGAVTNYNPFDVRPIQFVFAGGEGAAMPLTGQWKDVANEH